MGKGRPFLNELIKKAIEEYNKYRAPESKAKLVKVGKDEVVVDFEGPFCHTCGINEWVEDFVYVLEDLNVRAKLVKVEDFDDIAEKRRGFFKIEEAEIKE